MPGPYSFRRISGTPNRLNWGRYYNDLCAALEELGAGSGFQPLNDGLTDISVLTPADSNIIVGDGTHWVAESGATARASLGVSIGSQVQGYDATLAALAALNATPGLIRQTGEDTFEKDTNTYLTAVSNHDVLSATHGDALAGVVSRGALVYGNATPKWARLPFPSTPTGKVLQATANDVAWSTNPLTIGASASVSGSNTGDQTLSGLGGQALDATLTALAGTGVANTFPYFTATDVAASGSITAVGLAILDDASASDQLTTLGVSTFAKTILDDADAAAVRSTIGAQVAGSYLTAEADTLASVMGRGATTGVQLTSTLAGGTAPFVVTSTTVCSNLNAGLLNGTTWTAPGAIGGTTAAAIKGTTFEATGATFTLPATYTFGGAGCTNLTLGTGATTAALGAATGTFTVNNATLAAKSIAVSSSIAGTSAQQDGESIVNTITGTNSYDSIGRGFQGLYLALKCSAATNYNGIYILPQLDPGIGTPTVTHINGIQTYTGYGYYAAGSLTDATGVRIKNFGNVAPATFTTQYGIEIESMTSAATNYAIKTGASGIVAIGSYLTTVGGVHVGGTSDPGTDNLTVDGMSIFTGIISVTSIRSGEANLPIRDGNVGDVTFFTGASGRTVWINGGFNVAGNVGKILSYTGVETTNNGVPSMVASLTDTSGTYAIAATTIYAVPAACAGLYRVSWRATIAVAATTSCVLGGSTGFQVKYTDRIDSVVKTSNPTTVVSSAVNATGTQISGVCIAACKASTNLQFLFGYTSVGATPMTFVLAATVEYLG